MTRTEFDTKLSEANRLMDKAYDLDSIFKHAEAAELFDRAEAILDELDNESD